MKEYICEEVPAVTLDGKIISTMLRQESELVRCKNCKHYIEKTDDEPSNCMIKAGYFPVSRDWYCADGEAKE